MNLQNSHAPWGCLLASAAMVLDVNRESLMALVGHDGGEIVFPDQPEPMKRQGFHIQEIIDVAVELGWWVMPIEVMPSSTTDGVNNFDIKIDNYHDRLMRHMANRPGIITGISRKMHHAVAWDGAEIYDPVGKVYSFDDIKMGVQVYYRFGKIKSV